MKNKMNFPFDKIIIPNSFKNSPPRTQKINQKLKTIQQHPEQIYLTINYRNVLLDGYASYLAAKKLSLKEINVRQLNRLESFIHDKTNADLYVWGKHTEDGLEYVWRVPNNKQNIIGNISKGDKLIVQTKNGPAPIIVTKTERKNYSPVDTKVRKVTGRAKY